jgi:hypothetical protein
LPTVYFYPNFASRNNGVPLTIKKLKNMSDTKVYQFGETANSGLLASVLPALQNKGVDTGYLLGMLNNGNNGGLFGGRGFEDIIALIIVAAIFGNGNFGFGGWGNNGSASTAEREMLMSAIQRNGVDLSQLAQTIGVSNDRIHDAIGNVSTQICTLAGQQGLSFQQVTNAILSGNATLASQLCDCCCSIKQLISESNYLTERGFCNTNQILTKGFSDIGYAFRDQTCNLEKAGSANTAAIIAKLDAIEDSRKDRELAEKDRVIATLTARSERQAELQPIYSALQEIQCNQPPVKKITCPEQYVPLNTSVNATYGLIPTYCGYGYGGFGFPYGNFCNGFNNAF